MKSAKPRKKPVKRKPLVHKANAAKRAIRQRRPLHKKVLLHPITVFFLLCVGVFIVGSTFRARADEVVVTAKVAAPALLTGADITSPLDGDTFTSNTVTVVGTCPVGSYVKVTRNAVLAGVASCDGAGAYEVIMSLFPGSNILQAQAYNITDDPGPVTSPVTVIYNAPVVIPPGPIVIPEIPSQGTTGQSVDVDAVDTPGDLPVILTSFDYKSTPVNNVFSWDVYLAGGKAPYTLYINWGDGTDSVVKAPKPEKLTITHTYEEQGYYNVKIKMVDARDRVSMMQLVAVIKSPITPTAINNVVNSTQSKSFFSEGWALLVKNWLAVAWGSYITVTLMAVSFWLGERQELTELALRRRHRGHKV